MTSGIDPITLSVVNNYLLEVAEEMGLITMRTARSNLIREGGDFSTALFDVEGRMVQHGRDIPAHLGLFPSLIKQFLSKYCVDDIREGDVFLTNVDDVAGSHLNDVKVFMPIFYRGRIVMWAANLAHWPDVGGFLPGSYYGRATEIYQEGLQITPVRIYKAGAEDRETVRLILKNVRAPSERLGDLRAQVSSLRLAEKRIATLLDKYGEEKVKECLDELIAQSELAMRKSISEIPAGAYEFEDYLDNDGVEDRPIRIRVSVRVSGDEITYDFAGTDGQAKGPVNSTYTQTLSACYYVTRCITDYNIPSNEGLYRPVHVLAPEGSVVNALPLAPRAFSTHETATRIVDVCLGALHKAIPSKVPAAGYGSSFIVIVGGRDPRTGVEYTWYEPIPGGFGARPGLDGIDGTRVHMGNTSNTPIEVFEHDYPLLCEKYEFITDSCGAGKYRGGLGVCKIIKALEIPDNYPILSSVSERNRFAPYGLKGGRSGKTGFFKINPGSRGERDMPGPCPGKSYYRMSPGESVGIFSAGGGGWGDPLDRDPGLVLRDVIDEKVSMKDARDVYGVVIDERSMSVDYEATKVLRVTLRGAR